jgi:hypothetical protein
MSMRVSVVSVGFVGILSVASATASQHEHETGATAIPSSAQVTQCSQAQPVIMGLLDAALKRLERARLTNSPPAMRDAADDVQSALVDVRAQLAPCAALQIASSDPHAGHATPAAPSSPPMPSPAGPTTPAPEATQQRPAAPADLHAGYEMPAPKPATSRASSAATRPSTADPR